MTAIFHLIPSLFQSPARSIDGALNRAFQNMVNEMEIFGRQRLTADLRTEGKEMKSPEN
ncbi:hypothetical protein [Sinorhizobium terangae]|uniref:Uncharacterized protein n=1 Tax=Sinorhizobium terangae TaxID=110322 RepID=A0A6N7L7J8_SINTE|nr:hypothetical protein [Sinorhizobium terangae]MBB4185477.1 hypothetical protein [Sinorhizobium terangae]MQX13238.1 hypothetical protein [Sinorhizobium terangae]WFU46451.1 hypothetical protein QA637_11110 [Sinorhizobium terangae]